MPAVRTWTFGLLLFINGNTSHIVTEPNRTDNRQSAARTTCRAFRPERSNELAIGGNSDSCHDRIEIVIWPPRDFYLISALTHHTILSLGRRAVHAIPANATGFLRVQLRLETENQKVSCRKQIARRHSSGTNGMSIRTAVTEIFGARELGNYHSSTQFGHFAKSGCCRLCHTIITMWALCVRIHNGLPEKISGVQCPAP